MDNPTNISQEVYDLTPQQLGTALYHIANNTQVSLEYTARFKRDVQNRASAILCNAIPVEAPSLTAAELEELCHAVMLDTEVQTPYERAAEYYQPDNPELQSIIEEMYDTRVRQCVSDPSVSCHCTLGEQLQCEWSNDDWEINSKAWDNLNKSL